MMKIQKYHFAVLRNILLALFSAGWLLPLSISNYVLLEWFYYSRYAEDDAIFHLEIAFSQGLFNVAAFWLGLVIIFWSFMATNKLWPPKGKKAK